MKRGNVGFCLITVAMIAAFGWSALGAASSEPDNSTPQQVFDGMRQSFRAEKAKGVHARYQWQLSGPNGGEWWIDVNDGTYKMGKGKVKGTWAFLTGRLRVRGDQKVARKLDEIFP